MLRCSAHIRAKPGWFDKMNEAAVVSRWTQEAVAQGLTEAQVAGPPAGSLAEVAVMPETGLYPVPDEMTFADAAAMLIPFTTGHLALQLPLRCGMFTLLPGLARGAPSRPAPRARDSRWDSGL
ncbi:hypothetical protein GCM10023205_19160 [Yinghuangia aomiensis]|uniref:Uncharacterized protein n=1 Tax=Yinghuangia aomiensis TaxID=676205 RepID=A0ABP9GYD7_9ACTN